MKWNKKGLIIQANGQHEWMSSHIQNPYAVVLEDRVRVYFTTRPKPQNGLFKSTTAFMDLEKDNLLNVIGISTSPILDYGTIGTFDEFGIMPGSVVKKENGDYWLYYAGWSRAVSTPYTWAIGLAISQDGGTHFEKFGNGPIMSINCDEPYLLAAPRSVFKEGGIWHMYYGSGTGWMQYDGKTESTYLNRHAESQDGIHWIRDKKCCVDKVYEDESQSACCIIRRGELFQMFFPYRHSYEFRNRERGYLIGYAYSHDLKAWTRDDAQVGIDVSKEGWDSEMICYPNVIKLDDKYIMFYCGNGFGCGGMGYAELEE